MSDPDKAAKNFFAAALIAFLFSAIIIGPLFTGLGLIFGTFLQAVGAGMVSFVISMVAVTIVAYRGGK